ncbi:MAG: hypothetical protein ABWX93_06835 [Pseudoxanthomonas sp.]
MKTIPDNALTLEERELALLLSRQGPHGEPSAALDSRILGAAHAAVGRHPTRKPKPRWPVAMGLAASVVLAVGIAWQLRPVQQSATLSEAPVAYPAGENSAAAASDSGMASAQPAEAANETAVADRAASVAPAPVDVVAPPAAPISKPQPLPAPALARSRQPRPTTQTLAPSASPVVGPPGRYDAGIAPPAPPPPAPAATMAPAEATEPAPAFVADAQADALARQEAAAVQEAVHNSNAAAAKQAATHGDKAASARDMEPNRELDRVEVSGSRLRRTDLQVPVSEDAQLAVDEWLERVRTRYGLGDAGAARQSLLLFVRDHPEEPVPDDLEPLLDK